MIQGPDPGEYIGLTVEEQEKQNAMYRDLNAWNTRALNIAAAREAGECSCDWFGEEADPYCAVHNTGQSQDTKENA